MKPVTFAFACTLAACVGTTEPQVAAAASTPPSFTISDCATVEGGGCIFTIRKSAKANSYSKITVTTVETDTAKAGRDFVAKTQSFTVGNNTLVVYFNVGTIGNAVVDGNRYLNARVTVQRFATLTRPLGTGTVKDDDVAPPPPPVVCPDGTTLPAGSTCPPVVTEPSFVSFPLGTARRGLGMSPYARALRDCASIYANLGVGNALSLTLPGVTKGQVYKLTIGGPTAYPFPNSPFGAWGYSPKEFLNVDGMSGDTWTLEHPNGGEAITVAEACLEGVRPA
jgi:hypothetical protein